MCQPSQIAQPLMVCQHELAKWMLHRMGQLEAITSLNVE